MKKLIDNILCFFRHKIKRTTFKCWCSRCGIIKYWNGCYWTEEEGPVCLKCGGWIDSNKSFGDGDHCKCKCGENDK